MKKTLNDYIDLINAKKWDAHNKNWLYIELNAKDLVDEFEGPKVSNIKSAAQALLDTMLEGDRFIVTPKIKTKLAKDLTVRFYCDNLDPSRKKYSE